MNYLDYLETGNKVNWLTRPIDTDKRSGKSSWLAVLSDLFKKSKSDEKNSVESNKNTPSNSSKPRNRRVVHINADNESNSSGTVGNVRYRVTTEYNS